MFSRLVKLGLSQQRVAPPGNSTRAGMAGSESWEPTRNDLRCKDLNPPKSSHVIATPSARGRSFWGGFSKDVEGGAQIVL